MLANIHNAPMSSLISPSVCGIVVVKATRRKGKFSLLRLIVKDGNKISVHLAAFSQSAIIYQWRVEMNGGESPQQERDENRRLLGKALSMYITDLLCGRPITKTN